MKYLWGTGMGSNPQFNPGASAGYGTVTLVGSGSMQNIQSKNVELIVNISRNVVYYNKNNPESANATTFSGGGTADVVVEYDNSVPGSDSKDIVHTWVEVPDGRSGIDFLSELAVKDRTYAAIKNTDITLEAESLNIDLTSTNAELSNLQDRTGGTASATGDSSVIGLLKRNQETLDALISIPEQAYFAFGNNVTASFGIAGVNLGANGQDLHKGDYAVVVRALTDNVQVTLGSQEQFNTILGGTAFCQGGGCDGFVGDLIDKYTLPKDDFLEAKAKMVQIYDAGVTGPTGTPGTIAQVTVVKTAG